MGYTSTEVKARWNKKHYTQIVASVPKELAEKFKKKCVEKNVSQAAVIKAALEKFIQED